MKSEYKILIVSHNSFSKTHNNGKTLESLFGNFKKNNLAQLYFSKNEYPDFDYCDNYFQITDIDVLSGFLKLYSKCGGVVDKNTIVNCDNNEDLLFDVAKSKLKNMTFFRDLLWKTCSWKTRELDQWCNDFNPDAVFYVGGNQGFSHSIACYISKTIKRPLITYFTDDYLIFPISGNSIEKIQRWCMKRFYKKTIDQSLLLFTIGELMSKEYTSYFGRDFFSIMNSVPILPYIPYKSNHKIVISYFGGLHLDRWKMMLKLASSVENVEFNVYSIAKPSQGIMKAFQEFGIVYKGGVQGEDLRQAILNSDILLHVESDDDYYRSLTRLSVSTKIPEYLMSGRFVLGFGPVEVASMRILSDNNIGIVVSSAATVSELKSVMSKIVEDCELRSNIGLMGYNFAVENFNNVDIVDSFTNKIDSIINSYKKCSKTKSF